MAEPLPDGYTDTGVTRVIHHSGKVRLLQNFIGSAVTFGEGALMWRMEDASVISSCFPPEGGGAGFYRINLSGPFAGSPVALEGPTSFGCVLGPWDLWSTQYSYTLDTGPFRLGVKLTRIETDPIPVPEFWDNWKIEYRWFADEASTYIAAFGPYTSPTLYFQEGGGSGAWGASPDTGMTPIEYPLEDLDWGYECFSGGGLPDQVQAEFRELKGDGATINTTDLDDPNGVAPVMHGTGGGGVDCYERGPFTTAMNSAGAPWRLNYNLDISKFGTSSTGAHVIDSFVVPKQFFLAEEKTPQADYLVMPYMNNWVIDRVSWNTHRKEFFNPIFLHIDIDWAADQDPPIPPNDRQVPIYASPARIDPGTIAPYRPLGWGLLAAVNVHRPNGLTPSSWVSSDTGKLTVAEGSNSVFTVSEVGATVTRTLVTAWRGWMTPGDPNHSLAVYEVTKHDYFGTGPDVFGWQHHGWLRVSINAPEAGDLTLTVTGVHLEVDDPHDGTEPTKTESAFTATYPVPLSTGANQVWVDLLFPNEGGPFYYGRVDSLRLAGFLEGVYTLSELALRPREDAYLKLDFGAPVTREDYDAIVMAVDGAFNLGNWPDQDVKTERGERGGGVRYVQPFNNVEGIADFQRALSAFGENPHRLEGFIAVYDLEAYEDANKDTFGNSLGPELAQWLWSIAPYERLGPAALYLPACSPRVRMMHLVPGQDFQVWVRWPLWAAIEVMVGQEGTPPAAPTRAPAGILVTAIRTDTDEEVRTGVTDASGYAVIHPVPGELTYRVE